MSGVPPGLELSDPMVTAALLGALSGLFLLRVLGQLLVVMRAPRWLPPMEQWYSGLLPYPLLLTVQLLILVAMAIVIVALIGRVPWIRGPHPSLGTAILVVAYGYAGSMVVRYVVRMARRADQRWLGGCIPIAFHVVLATWLFVLASQWRPVS